MPQHLLELLQVSMQTTGADTQFRTCSNAVGSYFALYNIYYVQNFKPDSILYMPVSATMHLHNIILDLNRTENETLQFFFRQLQVLPICGLMWGKSKIHIY